MSYGIFSAAHQSRLQGINPPGPFVPPVNLKNASRPKWTRARTVDGYQMEMDPSLSLNEAGPREARPLYRKFPAHDPTQPTAFHESPSSKQSSMANVMAPKTYTWISLWFLITVPVIAWDVGFCFMRPRSFFGGDLHWLWKPYAIYQNVDYVYGVAHFENGNGFTNAQSFLNIVETVLNIVYLYLAHVSAWPSASLVGFSSALMTLSKTVLYWLQEYYCNYCAIGHNSVRDVVIFWIIPNGLWIVFPALIVRRLGKDLVVQLDAGAKGSSKRLNGKAE